MHAANIGARNVRRIFALLPLLALSALTSCLLTQATTADLREYRAGITNFIVPGEEELLVLAGAGNDPSSGELKALYRRHYLSGIESALNSWGGRQLQKIGALFDENFRLSSSLSWSHKRGFRGALEAVVPLHARENASWFLQPGFVIWEGAREKTRRDINLGFVHRQYLPDWKFILGGGRKLGVGGGVFIDHSTTGGLSRLGLGFDLQDEFNYASAQFYTPITRGWRAADGDYEERALGGVDARLSHQLTRHLDITAALSAWKKYDGVTGDDLGYSPAWRTGVDYELARGLSLAADYASGDDDARSNLQVHLRFQYPAKSRAAGEQRFDIWRPFNREQRILYAERKFLLRVTADAAQGSEGGNAEIRVKLPEAVSGVVRGSVTPKSGTGLHGATAGADFAAEAQDFAIASGEIETTVQIALVDDNLVEGAETFAPEIALTQSPSRVVAGGAGVVTILDNDSAAGGGQSIVGAALSATPQSLAESAGTVTLRVAASLDRPAPEAATIALRFAMPPGRASVTANPPLQIAAHARSGEAEVTLRVNDNVDEDGDAEITIGGGKLTAVATVTPARIMIRDDDPLHGKIAVTGALREHALNTGVVEGELIFTLSGDARFAAALSPQYTNVPAGLTPQLTRESGTRARLSFGGAATAHASVNSANFVIEFATGDFANARAEFVDGARVSNLPLAFIDAPQLRIATTALSVREGGGASVTLTLERAAAAEINGAYALIDGSASGGADYVTPNAQARAFRIAAGATQAVIRVSTLDNNIRDGDKSFSLRITRADDNLAAFDGARAISITILDDEGAPQVLVDRSTIRVDEDSGHVMVTVRLSHANNQAVAGACTITGTGARPAAANADYRMPGTCAFSIPAGQVSDSIRVELIDDSVDELDESFMLTLQRQNDDAASLGAAASVVTIRDDDAPPALSAADARVTEGGEAVVRVSLTGRSDRVVNANFRLIAGSAQSGADYRVPAESARAFRIAAGAGAAELRVATIDDAIYEQLETFTLRITAANGTATVADADARISIVDNDGAPLIRVTDTAVSVNEGGSARIGVALNRASSNAIRGAYSLAANTAGAADYSGSGGAFTIAAGAQSAAITVVTRDDQTYEGDETFTVQIALASGETGAQIGTPARATVTIVDDEKAGLVITPQSAQKIYGAADPAAVYSANFRDGDTQTSVFSASPLTRAPGETVGAYRYQLKNPLPFKGNFAAKYSVSLGGANALRINKKVVRYAGTANKIYDGTANLPAGFRATPSGIVNATVNGVRINDSGGVTLSGGAYANANAGAKTVTGFSLSGARAANYTLQTDVRGTISRKQVTYTSAAANKIYDASKTAPASLGGNFASGDIASGDAVTAGGGQYASADAGSAIAVSGFTLRGASAANYTLASASRVTGRISKRQLRVTANFSAPQKPTDLTNRAHLTITPGDLAGGDTAAQVFSGAIAIGARSGKTAPITIGSLSVAPTSPGKNYTLAFTNGVFTFDALQTLTIFPAAAQKVYGGSDPGFSYTANFTDGDSKSSVFSAIPFTRATGEDAGARVYVLKNPVPFNANFAQKYSARIGGAGRFTITPKTVTYTSTQADKIYDAATNAPASLRGTFASGDILNGDLVSVTGGNYASANAGANIAISGFRLSGGDAGNYTLSNASSVRGGIAKKEVTYTSAAANKIYDATQTAPDSLGGNFAGGDIAGGDTVTVTGGNYATAEAGAAISLTGFALSGADAGNYILASASSVSGDISRRPLRVTANFNGDTVPADLTERALLTVTAGDLVGGHTAAQVFTGAIAVGARSGGTAVVSIGSLAVTATSPGKNYALAFSNGVFTFGALQTLVITPRAAQKVYGGDDPAFLYDADFINGDTQSAVFSATPFARAPGEDVNAYAFQLKNPPPFKANFAQKYSAQLGGANEFAITRKEVTYASTSADKTYDGGTTPPASFSAQLDGVVNRTVNGVAIDDTAKLRVTGGAYADKNAGANKTLSGFALAGDAAANYTLTANVRGEISRKEVTYTATSAGKIYDNTTTAPQNFGGTFASGDIVSGDDVDAGGGAYASANAGTAIGISGFTLRGAQAGNYTLSNASSVSGDITPKEVTYLSTAADKVYDGGGAAPSELGGAFTSGDILGSDAVDVTGGDYETFGAGNLIDITGFALSGAHAGNYALSSACRVRGAISKRPLRVTVNLTRNVLPPDLSARDLLAITAGDLAGGDTAEEVLTGAIAIGARTGDTASVTIGSLATAATAPGTNYALEFTNGQITFTDKLVLTITAAAAQKVYGAQDPAFAYAADFASGDSQAAVFTAIPIARAPGETAGTYAYRLKTEVPFQTGFEKKYALQLGGTNAFTIARKNLMYVSAAASKTYDGSAAAPSDLGGNFTGIVDATVNGVVINDTGKVHVSGGAFADKNVGDGKTVGGVTLGGARASNYTLSADVRGDISAKIVAYTSADADKVYDATTAAPQNLNGGFASGDIADADDVDARGGNYASANVGTAIAMENFTLGGADAGNYTLAKASAVSGDITRRPLRVTVAIAGPNTPADLTDRALLTITPGDLVGGHTAAQLFTGAIAIGARSGSTAPVTIGSLKLRTNLPAKNYELAFSDGVFTFSAKQTLAITPVAMQKVYGGADPAFTYQANFTDGDTASAVFSEIPFTRAGGEDAAEYAYQLKNPLPFNADFAKKYAPSLAGNNAFTVTPKTVTYTSTAANKIYDAAKTAPDSLGGNFASGDILNNDDVDATGGSYASAAVGTAIAVTGFALSGADAGNYALANASSVSGGISKRPLRVTANFSGDSVPADLTNRDYLSVTLGDLAGSHTAAQVLTGAIAVGARSGGTAAVTIGTLAVRANSPGKNYELAFTDGVFTFTALQTLTITPGARQKVYGDDDPAFLYDADFINGDTQSAVFSATPFARAPGENVNAYAYVLKSPLPFNANFAQKYSAQLGGANSFSITRKEVTYASTSAGKVYDGGTTPPASISAQLSGVVNRSVNGVNIDDTASAKLRVTGGAYADKNAGANKALSGFALAGDAAANYTLTANVRGEISRKQVTVDALTLRKEYDGGTAVTPAAIEGGVQTGIAGETLTLRIAPGSDGAYQNADAASSVDIENMSGADFELAGNTAALPSNYSLPAAVTVSGVITQKPLALAKMVFTKVYDGGVSLDAAQLSGGAVSGAAGTQTFSVQLKTSADAVYANANAASQVTISNIDGGDFTLQGGNAASKPANYLLPQSVDASGVITRRALRVRASGAAFTADAAQVTLTFESGSAEGLLASHTLNEILEGAAAIDADNASGNTAPIVKGTLRTKSQVPGANYALDFLGGTFTFLAPQLTLQVSPPSASAQEGRTFTLTARLETAARNDVRGIFVIGADGDTASADDYTNAGENAFTIAAGDLEAQLQIVARADDVHELEETFSAALQLASGETGAALGADADVKATLTIKKDDGAAPSLSLAAAAAQIAEGDAATIALQLSGASSAPVSVSYTFADGTATHAQDYTAGGGVLTIPAGGLGASLRVTTVDDALDEDDETFTLRIALFAGETRAQAGAHMQTEFTILDNDVPQVQFQTAAHSVTEGDADSTLELGIEISPPPFKTRALQFQSNPGGGDTALLAADYALPAELQLAAGATFVNLRITVTADTAPETDEIFRVKLLSGDGYAVAGADTASVTILQNDHTVNFTRTTLALSETGGAVGAGIELSHALPEDFTGALSYQAGAQQGAARARDYTAAASYTIAAGDTAATVTLTPVDDNAYEYDETFQIHLLPQGAVSAGDRSIARATIADKGDKPRIALRAADGGGTLTIGEGARATLHVHVLPQGVDLSERGIYFERIGVLARADVNADTRDASADGANADYQTPTATYTAGAAVDARLQFSVQSGDDALYEGDEVLVVTLNPDTLQAELATAQGSTPAFARLQSEPGQNRVTITIADADSPPPVALSLSPPRITDEAESTVTVTARLDESAVDNMLTARIPVTAEVSPQNAASGIASFVIEIPPDNGGASLSISVTPAFDIGGEIAFAIGDALEHAVKAANSGATLTIEKTPPQLQLGTVYAQNAQGAADPNAAISEASNLTADFSFTRDLAADALVHFYALKQNGGAEIAAGALTFAAAENSRTPVAHKFAAPFDDDYIHPGRNATLIAELQNAETHGVEDANKRARRTFTAADDDAGEVQFAFNNARVTEGNTAAVTLALSRAPDPPGIDANAKTFFEITDAGGGSARASDWSFAAAAHTATYAATAQVESQYAKTTAAVTLHTVGNDTVEGERTLMLGVNTARALFAGDALQFSERYTLAAPGVLTIADDDTATLTFAPLSAYPGQPNLILHASLDADIILLGGASELVFSVDANSDGSIAGVSEKLYPAVTLRFTDANADGKLSGEERTAQSAAWQLGLEAADVLWRKNAGHFAIGGAYTLPGRQAQSLGTAFALPDGHALAQNISVINPRVNLTAPPDGTVAFGASPAPAAQYSYTHLQFAPGQVPEEDLTLRIPVTVTPPQPGDRLEFNIIAATAQPQRASHAAGDFKDFTIVTKSLAFTRADLQAGQTSISKNVEVQIHDDAFAEGDENIRLEISGVTNTDTTASPPAASAHVYGIAANGGATLLRIIDDEAGSATLLFASGQSARENTLANSATSASTAAAFLNAGHALIQLTFSPAPGRDTRFEFAVTGLTSPASVGVAQLSDWQIYDFDTLSLSDPANGLVFNVRRGETAAATKYFIPRADALLEGDEVAKFGATASAERMGISVSSAPGYNVTIGNFQFAVQDLSDASFAMQNLQARENTGAVEQTLSVVSLPELDSAFSVTLDAQTCAGVSVRTPSPTFTAGGAKTSAVTFAIADDDTYELPQLCEFTVRAPAGDIYAVTAPGAQTLTHAITRSLSISDDDSALKFTACESVDGDTCSMALIPADNGVASPQRLSAIPLRHVDADGGALNALAGIHIEYAFHAGADIASAAAALSTGSGVIAAGQNQFAIPLPQELLALANIGKSFHVRITRAQVTPPGDAAHEVYGAPKNAVFTVGKAPPEIQMQRVAPAPTFMDEDSGVQFVHVYELKTSAEFDYDVTAKIAYTQPVTNFYDAACDTTAAAEYRARLSAVDSAPAFSGANDGERTIEVTIPAGATSVRTALRAVPVNDACDNDGSGIITAAIASAVNAKVTGDSHKSYVIDDDQRDLYVIYAKAPDTPEKDITVEVIPGSGNEGDTYRITFAENPDISVDTTGVEFLAKLTRAPNEREGAVVASFAITDGQKYFTLDNPNLEAVFPPAVKDTAVRIAATANNKQFNDISIDRSQLYAAPKKRKDNSTDFGNKNTSFNYNGAQLQLQLAPGIIQWVFENVDVAKGQNPRPPLSIAAPTSTTTRVGITVRAVRLNKRISYLLPLHFDGDAVAGTDYVLKPPGATQFCVYDGRHYLEIGGSNATSRFTPLYRYTTTMLTFPVNARDPSTKHLRIRIGTPDNPGGNGIIAHTESAEPGSGGCPDELPKSLGTTTIESPHTVNIRIHRENPVLLSADVILAESARFNAEFEKSLDITVRTTLPNSVTGIKIPLNIYGAGAIAGIGAAPTASAPLSMTFALAAGQASVAGKLTGLEDDIVEPDKPVIVAIGDLDTANSGYAAHAQHGVFTYIAMDLDDSATVSFTPLQNTLQAGDQLRFAAAVLRVSNNGGIQVGAGGALTFTHTYAAHDPLHIVFRETSGNALLDTVSELNSAAYDIPLLGGVTKFDFNFATPSPTGLIGDDFNGPDDFSITARDTVTLRRDGSTHMLDEGRFYGLSFARGAQSAVTRAYPLRLQAGSDAGIADFVTFAGDPAAPAVTFAPTERLTLATMRLLADGIVEGEEQFTVEWNRAHANWPGGYSANGVLTYTIVDKDRAALQVFASEPVQWSAPQTVRVRGNLVRIVNAAAETLSGIEVGAGNSLRFTTEDTLFKSKPLVFTDTTGRDGSGSPDGYLTGRELVTVVNSAAVSREDFYAGKKTRTIRYALDETALPRNIGKIHFSDSAGETKLLDDTARISVAEQSRAVRAVEGGTVKLTLQFSEPLPRLADGSHTVQVQFAVDWDAAEIDFKTEFRGALNFALPYDALSHTVEIAIPDDDIVEGVETNQVKLFIRTRGIEVGSGEAGIATITIDDNDQIALAGGVEVKTLRAQTATHRWADVDYVAELVAPGGIEVGTGADPASPRAFIVQVGGITDKLSFIDVNADGFIRGTELRTRFTKLASVPVDENTATAIFALTNRNVLPRNITTEQFSRTEHTALFTLRTFGFARSQLQTSEGALQQVVFAREFDLNLNAEYVVTPGSAGVKDYTALTPRTLALFGAINPLSPQQVTIPIVPDNIVEGAEEFTLRLSETANLPYAVGNDELTVTIAASGSATLTVTASPAVYARGEKVTLTGVLDAPGGIEVGAGGTLQFLHPVLSGNIDMRFRDTDDDGLLTGGELTATANWLTRETEPLLDKFALPASQTRFGDAQFPTSRVDVRAEQIIGQIIGTVEGVLTPANPNAAAAAEGKNIFVFPLRAEFQRENVRIPLRIENPSAADYTAFGGKSGPLTADADTSLGKVDGTDAGRTIALTQDNIVEGNETYRVAPDPSHADWPEHTRADTGAAKFAFTILDDDTASLRVRFVNQLQDTIYFRGDLTAPGGIAVGSGGATLTFRAAVQGETVSYAYLRFTDANNDSILSGGELTASANRYQYPPNHPGIGKSRLFYFEPHNPPGNLTAKQFANMPAVLAVPPAAPDKMSLRLHASEVREGESLRVSLLLESAKSHSFPVNFLVTQVEPRGGSVYGEGNPKAPHADSLLGSHTVNAAFDSSTHSVDFKLPVPVDGLVEGDENFQIIFSADNPGITAAGIEIADAEAGETESMFTVRDTDTTVLRIDQPNSLTAPNADITFTATIGAATLDTISGAQLNAAGMSCCDVTGGNETESVWVGKGGSIAFQLPSLPNLRAEMFTFTDTTGRGGSGEPDGVISHNERTTTLTLSAPTPGSVLTYTLRPIPNFPSALLKQFDPALPTVTIIVLP